MRIAVCDDSKREQKQFWDAFHELNVVDEPECFSDGASFLEAARKKPAFDLAFLDIYMPNDNGPDIAKKLQKISPDTGIVFVTSSREHAVDAFSLHVLHYLVKPITAQGIGEAIRRYKLRPVKKRPTIILVSGRGNHTVYLDEIIYIQSDRHAKEVYLTEGRLIKIWTPLNELEEKLDTSFLKLGRSTIVNMEQIEQMGTDSCILRDGTRLENVTVIGTGAFSGCTKLKSVTIGTGVVSINSKAFYNCTSLTTLTIPASVTKIWDYAFKGCSKLSTLKINSTKLTTKTLSGLSMKGISTKTVIKVPKSKVKTYTTLFVKKGLSKKVVVKSL